MGNKNILQELETGQVIFHKEDLKKSTVDSPHQHFLNGEYRIILQLIAVLQYGKQAKCLTDLAVDACNHVQNLRLAIYDYKLRVEACEIGSRKHTSIHGVAINYLVRYFYLIVFADYLLEETRDYRRRGREGNASRPVKFSVWLEERREIKNIVLRMSQVIE